MQKGPIVPMVLVDQIRPLSPSRSPMPKYLKMPPRLRLSNLLFIKRPKVFCAMICFSEMLSLYQLAKESYKSLALVTAPS